MLPNHGRRPQRHPPPHHPDLHSDHHRPPMTRQNMAYVSTGHQYAEHPLRQYRTLRSERVGRQGELRRSLALPAFWTRDSGSTIRCRSVPQSA
eukprot:265609-Rhodomonas_salina.3